MLESPDKKYSIPLEILNLNPKLLIGKEQYFGETFTSINPIKMNFASVSRHMDKIKGTVTEDIWKITDNKIPVILGVNFANKFNVGDIINFNGYNFHIIGVLSESILYQTHYDSILTAKDTSGKFILPIEDADYSSLYNNDPIIISNGTVEKVETVLKDFKDFFDIRNYADDYEFFCNDIKYDLLKKNIRTSILICFKFIFNKINNLTPKEMLEDFNK